MARVGCAWDALDLFTRRSPQPLAPASAYHDRPRACWPPSRARARAPSLVLARPHPLVCTPTRPRGTSLPRRFATADASRRGHGLVRPQVPRASRSSAPRIATSYPSCSDPTAAPRRQAASAPCAAVAAGAQRRFPPVDLDGCLAPAPFARQRPNPLRPLGPMTDGPHAQNVLIKKGK